MSYEVRTISVFERQAKRLLKKYPSFINELRSLTEKLKQNPKGGIPIGHNCYKIRVAIKGKGKGKSGGARVIIHVIFKKNRVYLLSVYDKSETANISDKEIKNLLKNLDNY